MMYWKIIFQDQAQVIERGYIMKLKILGNQDPEQEKVMCSLCGSGIESPRSLPEWTITPNPTEAVLVVDEACFLHTPPPHTHDREEKPLHANFQNTSRQEATVVPNGQMDIKPFREESVQLHFQKRMNRSWENRVVPSEVGSWTTFLKKMLCWSQLWVVRKVKGAFSKGPAATCLNKPATLPPFHLGSICSAENRSWQRMDGNKASSPPHQHSLASTVQTLHFPSQVLLGLGQAWCACLTGGETKAQAPR